MENEAVVISQHKTTSHIVEKLLTSASAKNLILFMTSLDGAWSDIITHKFASHIIQTTLDCSFNFIHGDTETEFDDGIKIISNLCGTLLEGFEELITHMYGSHVIRTMLEVLGGVKVSEKVLRSRFSRDQRVGNKIGMSTVSQISFLLLSCQYSTTCYTCSTSYVKEVYNKIAYNVFCF